MSGRPGSAFRALGSLALTVLIVVLPATPAGGSAVNGADEKTFDIASEVAMFLRTTGGPHAALALRKHLRSEGVAPESISFLESDYAFCAGQGDAETVEDWSTAAVADDELFVTVEIRSSSPLTVADVLSVLDLGAAVLDIGNDRMVVRVARTDEAQVDRLPFAFEIAPFRPRLILGGDSPRGERRVLIQSFAGDRRSFRLALEDAGAVIGRFEPRGQYYDVTSNVDLGPVLEHEWWVRQAVGVIEADRLAHAALVNDPVTEAKAQAALAEAEEEASRIAAENGQTIQRSWVHDGVFHFLRSDGSMASILRTSRDISLNFGYGPGESPPLVTFDDRELLTLVPPGGDPNSAPPSRFSSNHDTYADPANPSTNYSAETTLQVGAAKVGFVRSTSVSLDSAYTLTAASLYLKAVYLAYGPATLIGAYSIQSDWDQSTLVWNYRPAVSMIADDSQTFRCMVFAGCYDVVRYWNATSTVTSWLTGLTTNYGHALISNDAVSAIAFYSNHDPYYSIEYSRTCTYALNQTTLSFSGQAGSSTSLTVTGSPSGCVGTWSATDNASWMTVSPTSATGATAVPMTVSVDANTTGAGRTGTISFTGAFTTGGTVTVTQAPQCSYSLNRASYQVPSAPGTYSAVLSVTGSPAGCTGGWTATDDAAWLGVSPTSASGAGTTAISLTVQENTANVARTGRVTFAPDGSMFPLGSAFTLEQGASCLFTLSSTSQTIPASGGTFSVGVTGAPSPCDGSWNATEGLDWVTLTGPTTGEQAGTKTLAFTVGALPAGVSSRQGVITFSGAFSGGSILSLTQSQGACTFGISPTTQSVPSSGGGPYSMSVTGAPSGCIGDWAASRDVSWLTGLAPTSGSGSGTTVVTYSVDANSGAARVGHLSFAGTFATDSVLTVSQAGTSGGCIPDGATLCLMQGKFAVSLAARDQRTGRTGAGWSIPQSDLFGYFSIPALTFDAANPEVFVKILDGRSVNGRYWVFFGGLTDMEFRLTIRDTATGSTKAYDKAAGSACGGFDTSAFSKALTGGDVSGDESSRDLLPVPPYLEMPALETVAGASRASPEAGCTAGTESLCLNSSRFLVTLSATDHRTGRKGTGRAIPQNDIFGYFSIPDLTFNEGNPEVFVKVLDGRPVNGRFWVFYGGLTDFYLELTVRDTVTSVSKTYTRAGGSACGGFDTGAF